MFFKLKRNANIAEYKRGPQKHPVARPFRVRFVSFHTKNFYCFLLYTDLKEFLKSLHEQAWKALQ